MADWVANKPILDLCQRAEVPAGGERPRRRWWDQLVPLEGEEEERQVGRMGQGNGGGQGEGSSVEGKGEGGRRD